MARESSMEELLKAAFWNQMNKVFTALPCIVVNVQNDLKELRVDVQPTLNTLYQDKTTTPRPVIINVPVIFPATSTSALTMPVNVGDTMLCIFSMRAMEVWGESDGKPTTPNNHAKFNKKDAMAIAGLFPRKNSINNQSKRTLPHNTKDTVLAHNIGKSNEVEIRLKANGDVKITSSTKVEVVCANAVVNATGSLAVTSPTSTFNGNVVVNGNVNSTGTITAPNVVGTTDVTGGGKSLLSHLHSAVMSGGSNSGPPV